MLITALFSSFFFFNDTATTEIYTLSLHDALPISGPRPRPRIRLASWRSLPRGPLRLATRFRPLAEARQDERETASTCRDRKSTRLNSSHGYISYAVFCLKKKKKKIITKR